MKTSIIVKLTVEGLHALRGVKDTKYKDSVGFLEFPHRHQFHIEACKDVSHDDRDVEIIDFKRRIETYLKDKYAVNGVCDFGQMSCEMLAQELFVQFKLSGCAVLEDNENGAIVRADERDQQRPRKTNKSGGVIFFCGKLRSGKSTAAKAMASQLRKDMTVRLIEVSDVIRSLTTVDATREQLQRTSDLDVEVIKIINKAVSSSDVVIVSGARQLSILKAFPRATCVWVDAPEHLRWERFELDSKGEDATMAGFSRANKGDEELGINQVKSYILTR